MSEEVDGGAVTASHDGCQVRDHCSRWRSNSCKRDTTRQRNNFQLCLWCQKKVNLNITRQTKSPKPTFILEIGGQMACREKR